MGGEAAIAGAVLGGIAGFGGEESTATSRLFLQPASELERTSRDISQEQLDQLSEFTGIGPGRAEVADALTAQRTLADEVIKGGPGILLSRGQSVAEQLFAPQRLAIQQQFEQAGVETSRLSAQLGRQVDDPILRAKLAQAQGRQVGVLGAQQQATALQLGRQFGQEQFQQRIGGLQARAQILGGLSQQAFGRRQQLFGLGQQALSAERQFRLGTATRETTTTRGGGLGGAIGGALSGVGAGLSAATSFQALGGGQAPLTFAPQQQQFQAPQFGQSAFGRFQ